MELNGSEHLLCLIPFPEPKGITDNIRRRFPNLKLTYRQSKLTVNWAQHEGLPDEEWKDVTILCSLAEFPKDTKLAPNLEFVHTVSAGTDHMWNLPIYTDSHIPITTSSGIHGPMIAEWVIMTSLVASRKYNTLREWQISQSWDESQGGKALFQTTTDHVEKRLGILGYGSIGRHVAKIAKAMGMEVIVYTANPRKTPESKKDRGFIVPGTGDPNGEIPSAWYSGTDKKSLHHFLDQDLDQLLVSVPLTKATKHLLGKDEFEILSKRNAFISNIARGDIIVQDDLIEALKAYKDDQSRGERRKGLQGAALDVTTPEPLPKHHPLWDAPNCIITPHMSGVSREYAVRAFQVLEANLERRAEGKELFNVIDRRTGYAANLLE